MMYLLVSYDIVDNRTRSRVMKFLKNFGTRVQLSLFECDVDEESYRKIKRGVEEAIDAAKDRVRYYRLCQGCRKRVLIAGWGTILPDEDFSVI